MTDCAGAYPGTTACAGDLIAPGGQTRARRLPARRHGRIIALVTRRRKDPRVRGDRLKVGGRVRFRFGGRQVTGVIVEDRGPIGVGGRRLYTVRARLDSTVESTFEIPAHDLRAA